MRRALNRLSLAVSLIVCVALCLLWVRSDRRSDYASVTLAWRAFVVMSYPGGLKLSTWPNPVQPRGMAFASYEYGVRNRFGAWTDRPTVSWKNLGFDIKPLQFSNQSKPDRGAFELFMPFWFLVTLCLAVPLTMAMRFVRKRRRAHANLCHACGYDLRGSKGRCPECGAERSPSVKPAS